VNDYRSLSQKEWGAEYRGNTAIAHESQVSFVNPAYGFNRVLPHLFLCWLAFATLSATVPSVACGIDKGYQNHEIFIPLSPQIRR
jgi:hypothetical protein